MNLQEMLENCHTQTIKTIEDISEIEWDTPGVSGNWTVKEVLAHIAAYELLLVDTFKVILEEQPTPTPYMLRFAKSTYDEFNESAVSARRYHTAQQVENEYIDAQIQTIALLNQIPVEKIQQKGLLSWYKPELCLADFIGEICEHKAEHCKEIQRFRQKQGI